jgi:hypothetical protein
MHGPRVGITVARFLPDGLVSAIRDGPGDAVVAALEQSSETPELVWSPAMAASLGAQLATMAADMYREQTKGKVVEWDLPETSSGQQDVNEEPQVRFSLMLCSLVFRDVFSSLLFSILCLTRCFGLASGWWCVRSLVFERSKVPSSKPKAILRGLA